MNRSKIVLLMGVVLVIMVLLVSVGVSPRPRPEQGSSAVSMQVSSSQYQPTTSGPGMGFLSQSTTISLSGQAGQPPANDQPPTFQGKPVTSLSDVAKIIAFASSSVSAGTGAANANLLPLPNVPDSEIAIDASGSATVLDYMAYFNAHSVHEIAFDNKRFESVLKDKNGILLFTPGLIDKAIADNNFAEVHDSLIVQKDFANAELTFLKSIKVTGSAIPLHKEVIGAEKLLVDLIDKALAVESGDLSKNDLLAFYHEFAATVANAHQKFLAQSGALSFAPPPSQNWLDQALEALHLSQPAQAIGLNTPFGGMIGLPIFCLCDAGFWVIVGPPRPASLFVPLAFIASPLFYDYKSLIPGAWWLGLYNIGLEIPCLSFLFCTPVGVGGEIIIAGTSVI